MSDDFFEKYGDKVKWERVSKIKSLSDSFIRKFKDKLYWETLCVYSKMSDSIILEFVDRIIPRYKELIANCPISENTILILLDKLKTKNEIFNEHSLKKSEIVKNYDMYQRVTDEQKLKNYAEFWRLITKYQTLSDDFVEMYKSDIDWNYYRLFRNDEKFIEKFIDKYEAGILNYNCVYSEEFIDKYNHLFDFQCLSKSQILSEDIIRKYNDRVDWNKISSNPNYSEQFILDFKDKINWNKLSYIVPITNPDLLHFINLNSML